MKRQGNFRMKCDACGEANGLIITRKEAREYKRENPNPYCPTKAVFSTHSIIRVGRVK